MIMAEKVITELVQTIKFPEGVQIEVHKDNKLSLKANGQSLERTFKSHRINFELKGRSLAVVGKPANKSTYVLQQTFISHIKNMVEGLLYGYKYDLRILYSHFPMTATVDKDKVLVKNFLGEKFPRKVSIRGNAKVEVKGQEITVSGNNKEDVGQTASNLEQATKVRGKDIRRYQDGIYIVNFGNTKEKPAKVVEIINGREAQ